MGTFVIHEGRVVTYGTPPYVLPEEITEAFIRTLFSKEAGEDGFVGELAPLFNSDDKRRLRVTCKDIGGEIWRMYASHAARWASLINKDNRWHLEDFDIVFASPIGSWWADDVIITAQNVRFVTTPRGMFSFPEFQWQYGQNIMEHITEYQEKEVKRLDEVVSHITSELTCAELVVADREGNILVKKFTGLESQPHSEWAMPQGFTFISEAEEQG